MFLRTVVAVTLFTSLLGAAEPANSDIFSVRSFTDPKTKAKIPVNAQLFANADVQKLPEKALKEAKLSNGDCAIPLAEVKPAKSHDGIAQFAGQSHDAGGVMPPPIPACKGWN